MTDNSGKNTKKGLRHSPEFYRRSLDHLANLILKYNTSNSVLVSVYALQELVEMVDPDGQSDLPPKKRDKFKEHQQKHQKKIKK